MTKKQWQLWLSPIFIPAFALGYIAGFIWSFIRTGFDEGRKP